MRSYRWPDAHVTVVTRRSSRCRRRSWTSSSPTVVDVDAEVSPGVVGDRLEVPVGCVGDERVREPDVVLFNVVGESCRPTPDVVALLGSTVRDGAPHGAIRTVVALLA